MVELLFMVLGALLVFVFVQYEQKKDLEKRVKTLETDYLSLCDQTRDLERNLFQELDSQTHSLKAEMWKDKQECEVRLRDVKQECETGLRDAFKAIEETVAIAPI